MRCKKILVVVVALTVAWALPGAAWAAPLSPHDPTFKAVAAADAALFDAAFRCDLDTMAKYVADDLEFYHDEGGLAVGKADLVAKTRENICGTMKRELVTGTLEVYPVPGFGAIETGSHRFLHPAEPNNIGDGKFAHVWKLDGTQWKLFRVLSFH